MRKIVLFAATVAVVLATFGAYSVASADDRGNARVIRLREVVVQEAEIDNGEEGFGIGDAFVFGNDLYDRNRLVGEVGGVCTFVRADEATNDFAIQCNADLVLPDGQISVQGLLTEESEEEPTFTVAVVGGTGAYRNAHGEVTIRDISDTESEYTIRLT